VEAGAREWELDVRAPGARPIFAQVPRAVAQVEALNRLPYADQDAIRAAWAELTNSEPDPTFRLIPPVYSDQGINIRVGRDVFINHNCTLNDIGGITIGDEVFIGPRVSSSARATPSTRRGDGVTSQLPRSSSSAACGCAQARPSCKV
jgi:acetyltransferase-like isoleucine patch superfamily enzyme